MSDNTGLLFVGQIDTKHVKAAVYFNGDVVSRKEPHDRTTLHHQQPARLCDACP
jgi:hypothetical protein